MLEAHAFLLQQDLSGVAFEEFAVDTQWRTRMVSIADLQQTLAIVEFPEPVHIADMFGK